MFGFTRSVVVAALAAAPAVIGVQGTLAQESAYGAQSSPGQVELSVQPVWRDGGLVVEISANTHSVDLSGIDLTSSVRLRMHGREVRPVSATTLRGHHARGTVTFALNEAPREFEIAILGVPDQPERVLRWPAGS